MLIIAEIGTNWGGSYPLLKETATAAIHAGCDGVKLQIGLDKLYSPTRAPKLHAKMQKYAIDADMVQALRGWLPKRFKLWASVFDIESMEKVAPYLDCIKIASGDFTNTPLVDAAIEQCAKHDTWLAVSTGAATWDEIGGNLERIGKALQERQRYGFIAMNCDSQYPALASNAKLRTFYRFVSEEIDLPFCPVIGYSDHTCTAASASLAAALGYAVLEKHFKPETATYLKYLDNDPITNPDWETSTRPGLMKVYVDSVKDAIASLDGDLRNYSNLSVAELNERRWARRGSDGLRPTDSVGEKHG